MPLLEIEDLRVRYGAIEALRGISLYVDQGEVVALLGSNGAGKTTTLNTISGLITPSGGKAVFDGTNLNDLTAHGIVTRGLAHSPEGRKIFSTMTVEENLDLGAYMHRGDNLPKVIAEGKAKAYDLFPVIRERRGQLAGTLSGGEQQMLAMARALMAQPRLLALDEPSMGLAPKIVKQIFGVIQEINGEGVTVLLVEQNARMALKVANRAYVLETGQISTSGPSAELMNDEILRASYLGATA